MISNSIHILCEYIYMTPATKVNTDLSKKKCRFFRVVVGLGFGSFCQIWELILWNFGWRWKVDILNLEQQYLLLELAPIIVICSNLAMIILCFANISVALARIAGLCWLIPSQEAWNALGKRNAENGKRENTWRNRRKNENWWLDDWLKHSKVSFFLCYQIWQTPVLNPTTTRKNRHFFFGRFSVRTTLVAGVICT